MSTLLENMIRLEVQLADRIREVSGEILAARSDDPNAPPMWTDYGMRFPAYALAHLYATKHPHNPHAGQAWCAELAMKLADKFIEDYRIDAARGAKMSTGEWPYYIVPGVLELLGAKVGDERRRAWTEMLEAYAKVAMTRPFGFTAPNHDVWRCAALYRMGRALGREEWKETAVFMGRNLMDLQTGEGFWEESRHHGPSLTYNRLMLHGIARLQRMSGEAVFGEAAQRLARFMAAWVHPDGTTVGAFDGRLPTQPGMFPMVPGLETVPEGRALIRRFQDMWKATGAMDDVLWACKTYGNIGRIGFFFGDAIEYFSEAGIEDLEDTGLPSDREGVRENHSAEFDGLMLRRGPWSVALSSQNSDVARAGNSIYRLERQSRIELWHEQYRLLVGGGHNLITEPVPLALAILDTGFFGATEFGTVEAKNHPDRRAYYMPRLARSRMDGETPELFLSFAQGRVTFRVETDGNAASIRAAWQVRNVPRMCLQVPVVLWHGAKLSIDGAEQELSACAPRELKRDLRVEGGIFASKLALTPPKGVPCRVHAPLEALLTYRPERAEVKIKPPIFQLALVSCQWTEPDHDGEAVFRLALGK